MPTASLINMLACLRLCDNRHAQMQLIFPGGSFHCKNCGADGARQSPPRELCRSGGLLTASGGLSRIMQAAMEPA